MRLSLSALSLLLLAPLTASAADPVLRMSLGDPARRDKDVTLVLDAAVDTATAEALGPDQLAARLDAARLVLLGERHTSIESHRVQLQVLQALHRRGRAIAIGLEMFPFTEQPSLDAWNEGRWSEAEWLEKSRWYEHWGYHWGYYRDVLLFARAHGIPVHAVNAPRELVTAVRKNGLTGLTPEQASRMPPKVDADSADHLALFKAQVGGGDALHGGMTDAAWKGMQAAQATWDAAMAWNAVQALKRRDDPRAVVVVLVGSGHVAYGLGIERQAGAWFDGRVASVIPVPVADDKGETGPVRASYANFVWGVAREDAGAWPSLGLSTRAADGGRRAIIDVEKDGPAARAGLKVGDVIVRLDAATIDSREALSRQMATYNWGDIPSLTITRGGETLTVAVALRRTP
jgi:uncharacterized iron-regulated protein